MNIGEMFVRLGLDISEFSKGVSDVQSDIDRLAGAFTQMGSTLTAAITLPLTAIGGFGLKAFAGFEDEMLKVKAYAQTTGAQFEMLSAQAQKLGQDTMFSSKEAAEAMAKYAVSGFKVNEIYAAMPGVLDLAAAGQLKVSDAAQVSAGVLKGFGLAAGEAGRVADILAKTATSSATTVHSLGGSFVYAASIASSMGVKIEQLSAAFAALGDANIKGWKAGTAMRAFFLDLTSGSAKAEAALKNLGVSIWEAPGKFKDLTALLKEFYDSGITRAEKIGQAQAIWGARTSDVLTLIKAVNGKYAESEIAINNAAGAAKKMAEVRQSGMSGSWELFTSSIETFGIAVGKILAPAAKKVVLYLKDIIDAATAFVEKFGTLPVSLQSAILGLTLFVAAAGPVLVALGAVTGAVANLKVLPLMFSSVGEAFVSLGTKMTGVSAVVTQAMEAVSPANIKSGLSLLVESVKDFGTSIVASVKNLPATMGSIKNTVVGGFNSIGPAIAAAGTSIAGQSKAAVGAVVTQWEGFQVAGAKIVDSVRSTFAQIAGVFSASNIKAAITSVVDAVKGFGDSIVQGVKELPDKMRAIKTTVIDGFNAIGPALSSAGATVAGYAKTAVSAIVAQFAALSAVIAEKGLIGAIGALASSIGTGLVGALSAGTAGLWSMVTAIVAAAAPIAVVVAAIAAVALAGYAIYKNWEEIKAVLVGIWKDLQVAFAAFGKWFFETVEKVFGSEVAGAVKKVWEGIVKFFGSAWEAIKNVAANAFKYLLEGALAAANAIGASNTAAAIQSWIVKLDGMGEASKKMAASVATSMKEQADAAISAIPPTVKLAAAITGAGGAAELTKKQISELAKAKKQAIENSNLLSEAFMKLEQVFRAAPDSVEEFINKFSKIHEIPPEIQKAEAYIEELQKKFEKLGEEAKAAFAKGNKELGQGYEVAQEALGKLIAQQTRYLEIMKTAFAVRADIEEVIKSLGLLQIAQTEVNMEALKLPAIFKDLQNQQWTDMLNAPINGVTNLVSAFKALNIQSSTTLKKAAEDANYYYGVILKAYGEQKASLMDVKQAQLAVLEAQMKYAAVAGGNVAELKTKYGELRAELESAGIAIKGHTKAVRDYWQELDKQVSTIFTDMGKGIADAMFNAKSFGDFFKKTFEEMGKAIVRFTVEYWTKIWLTELYKGIKGMTDFGSAAAKSIKILTGVNAGEILGPDGLPLPGTGGGSGIPGAGLPGKDSLGGLTKAAGGLLGAIGAISSAIDAVFGALQYFQGRRIEQDVGRIEVTSRGMLNVLLQIQEVIGQYLPALQDLRFLQNFNLQMGQVADIITINFDKLIDAIKEGIKVTGDVNTTPDDPGGGGGNGGGPTVDPVTGLPTSSNDPNFLKKQIKELQDLLIKQAQSAANAAAVNAGILKDATDSTTAATNHLSDVMETGADNISGAVSNIAPEIFKGVDAASVITEEVITKSGSYFQAVVDTLHSGIMLNIASLDKTRLTQEQLIEVSRVMNQMLGNSMEYTDENGKIIKYYYGALNATAEGNTQAIIDNTTGTGANSAGLKDVSNALDDNSVVTDASTRAGIMTSAMLTNSEANLSHTMEIAAKTYANAAHITAPDFTSGFKSQSELEAYIAALGKMLGADKGAKPIYSDPLWKKYLELIGAYGGGGGGTPGGIGYKPNNQNANNASNQLFNTPTYADIFGDTLSQITANLNTAAGAASQFASTSSALNSYMTPGTTELATNPGKAVSIVNNFHGVTDPAKMANKIVQSMSLNGVTF